jgi:hypothetical protein
MKTVLAWLLILLLGACDLGSAGGSGITFHSLSSGSDTLLLESPENQFVGIVTDALFWQDSLVVVDALQKDVKVFDPSSGSLIMVIGREGSGPGEFLAPIAAAVTSENELAVLDQGLMRISIFREDGSLDRSWMVPGLAPGGIGAGPDETLLISAMMPGEGQARVRAIHRFSRGGEVLETFGRQPEPTHPGEASFSTLMVTAVGKTAAFLPFTSNQVHQRDLSSGKETVVPVGESFYQPPAWPEEGLATPQEAQEWAMDQVFALFLQPVDSLRFGVGFGEYGVLHEEWQYRWVILEVNGPEVSEFSPSPAVLAGIRQNQAYFVEIGPDGGTFILRKNLAE